MKPREKKPKEREEKVGICRVETCFLAKGLSPSKLSTKALCRDTRKRGDMRERQSERQRTHARERTRETDRYRETERERERGRDRERETGSDRDRKRETGSVLRADQARLH